MPSKLSIYNGALSILGERKLADLTENREPRYKLDDIWDNDLINRVLQHGQWHFAARAVELDFSPSVTPGFGYEYAFDKPVDHIRTMGVSYDEYFNVPIRQYSDEASWIFADAQIIYLKYVSNDSQFGADLSLWPGNFTEYVEHYMAYKVAPRLTGLDFNETELERKVRFKLTEAKSTDAMEGPPKFGPEGSWSSARRGYRRGNDRGSNRNLIG